MNNSTAPRFQWRALTSVLMTLGFMMLALSGIMLFLAPPGRVANWTNWTLLGLRKSAWGGLHIWFGTLFLVLTAVHVFFNWRPLLGYPRQVSSMIRTIVSSTSCAAAAAPGTPKSVSSAVGLIVARTVRPPSS